MSMCNLKSVSGCKCCTIVTDNTSVPSAFRFRINQFALNNNKRSTLPEHSV